MLGKIFHTIARYINFGFSYFKPEEPYVSDKTILLIDSDVEFCQFNGDVLKNQGFNVVVAHTLESAVVKLNAFNPPIVLLDHKLSDGSGLEFLEKNTLALDYKHIIFMTADSNIAFRATAMKPGVLDILPKPFQPSALNKMVYLAASFPA